ncbi:MAG: response regulator [Thermodesulfobacteriota bacterium]
MKKILVVDNDRIMLVLLSRFLKHNGYEVVTAENGIRAIDVLKTYVPDIIFIDLVMPNIDGKRLCRIIRSMKKFDDVYIVILSAISAEEDINIADMGVNACIAKGPFEEMCRYITEALDHPEKITRRCQSGEVLGIKDVYPRGITKELLLEKRHFEIMLDRMSEGIIEINPEGRIVFANATVLSMTAIPIENLLGSLFVDLFAGDERVRISDLLQQKGEKTESRTESLPLRLNQYFVMLDIQTLNESGSNSLVILRDVTDQKESESISLKSQKLQGMLEMAGAICHELNQPIQAILGFSDLLMIDMAHNDPSYDKIKRINEQVLKLGDITSKLSGVTKYETRAYLNGKIIDIYKSST